MFRMLSLLSVALIASVAAETQANLVTNGTFDTNLAGWDTTGTTTGVTWIAGTAHVGRTGTPGVAVFSQDIDIPLGTPAVDISFDYQWQVNPPTIPDTFEVWFDFAGGGSELLLSEMSSAVTFNSTYSFSDTVDLTGLTSGPDNGTITFILRELNSDIGTRIQLDNVVVAAIPEAGALTVWSLLSGVGLVAARRRQRDEGEE